MKEWFLQQTPLVKKLTAWLLFIVAISSVWGILKGLGVDALDFTIGCSSFSSQTQDNTNNIQRIMIQDSVNDFWKGKRRVRDSANTDKRFRKIEKKLHIESE